MPEIDKDEDREFKQSLNKTISEGNHVDYLQDVLKKYDYYKQIFSGIFTDSGSKVDVYVFEAVYENGPKATRVIQILGGQTFEDFASHIILSMGWVNDHLHGFDLVGKKQLPDQLYTAAPLSFFAEGWEDDPYPTYKSSQVLISDIDYKKQPVLQFIFDYGDGHRFRVSLIGHGKMDHYDEIKDFPRLIESSGRAPEQYPPSLDF